MSNYVHFLLVACLLALAAPVAQATVLWSYSGESGVCDTGVAASEWDYTQSGDTPNSRFFYRCATPVPGNKAGAKYLQVNVVNLQHDAWNIHQNTTHNLTPGTTYYFGAFLRFSRIGGVDIWHDGIGEPDSYDKLFEFYSNIRLIITSGFPDWANCTSACNGKFTFGAYLAFETCTSCIYEQIEPNVSPYSRTNFILADYDKWYAVVLAVTPSNGSTPNGRVQFWINGVKTTDRQNIKTQDTTAPSVYRYMYSGTIAQPAYDSPAHYRMIDGMIFADDLQDVINAGLMSDPEAGVTAPTVSALTCTPTTIQSVGTTTCTATASQSPTSYAWSVSNCAAAQCTATTPTVGNSTAYTCLYGGGCTPCVTATNAGGSSAQYCAAANYLTIRYRQPIGFGAN